MTAQGDPNATSSTYDSIDRENEEWPWKSKEQRLHEKTMKKYEKKHKRYISQKRIFKDDKIATLDENTDLKCQMVSKLLGNSKEALDI